MSASTNDYEYGTGDPVNTFDTTGQRSGTRCHWGHWHATCTLYLNEWQTQELEGFLWMVAGVAAGCALLGAMTSVTIAGAGAGAGAVCAWVSAAATVVAGYLQMVDGYGHEKGVYFRLHFWRTNYYAWGWHPGRWHLGGGYIWHQ